MAHSYQRHMIRVVVEGHLEASHAQPYHIVFLMPVNLVASHSDAQHTYHRDKSGDAHIFQSNPA